MECDKIISILENLINDIEELRNEENLFLIRFYFDFDKDVLDAAKVMLMKQAILKNKHRMV